MIRFGMTIMVNVDEGRANTELIRVDGPGTRHCGLPINPNIQW